MIRLDPETQQIATDLFESAGSILDDHAHLTGGIGAPGDEQITIGALLVIRNDALVSIRIVDSECTADEANKLTATGAEFDAAGHLTDASMLIVANDEAEGSSFHPVRGKQLKGFLSMLLTVLNDEAAEAEATS